MKGARSIIHFSYKQVENAYLDGRIPYPVFRQYCRFWDWGRLHNSGVAFGLQRAWLKKHGLRRTFDRINRVRKVLNLEPLRLHSGYVEQGLLVS